MPGVKYKITKHVKKQQNITHNEEKNKSIQTNPEMTWMI